MRSTRDVRLTAMDTTLRALADPTRLRVLALLVGGEVCVCHLHDTLDVPQPKASRHLAYLRRAGLVETRKDGLWVYYRLANSTDPVLRSLVHTAIHCAGHLDTVVRDRHKLEEATGRSVASPAAKLACCPPLSRVSPRARRRPGLPRDAADL
ncbi:MAG TPA: metalloregulator ArsR/SmtB family transcription factor [Vicinamibacterales bacterium]|jgi:ArsR family transcriptional regulator|nr:metalloregulator ArsR/SmtB family transcription factor [Vicinamibacterales bacterium]